jgi:hypothetical protein
MKGVAKVVNSTLGALTEAESLVEWQYQSTTTLVSGLHK